MSQPSIDWLGPHLGTDVPADGQTATVNARALLRSGAILRDTASVEDAGQAQTQETFAFKWHKPDTYRSAAMDEAIGTWLHERYARLLSFIDDREQTDILDVGCGGGNAAALLFGDRWSKLRYVGTDISSAVDVAADRLLAEPGKKAFVQADLMALPFQEQSFDVVFSEGVLHHTPSTRQAIEQTTRLVRPGGLYAIYVYSKKSPIREFTDDFIRDQLVGMSGQQAWDALKPLTKLGEALGKLDARIDIEEPIDLLGIPAGPIDVQRLFYWHVCKMFYRPDLTIEEMNHINFDWFTPTYAHRQTPEQTAAWITDAGLSVQEVVSEDAGHTVFATRQTHDSTCAE